MPTSTLAKERGDFGLCMVQLQASTVIEFAGSFVLWRCWFWEGTNDSKLNHDFFSSLSNHCLSLLQALGGNAGK
jgi:hypothetical protein